MSKKAKVIAIVILVVIIAVLVGCFTYKYIQKSKSTGTEWGDKYYIYLKEAKEKNAEERQVNYGITELMENPKIQFCSFEENKEPQMTISYMQDGRNFTNIYYINSEGNVSYMLFDQPSQAELLYNIELKQYIWYLHLTSEGEDGQNTEYYKPIENVLKEFENSNSNNDDIKTGEISAEYNFSSDEMTSNTEGEIPTISKFDETFIKTEVDESMEKDFNLDMDEKEFKDLVTEVVGGFKTNDQIITEEVKKDIDNKVNELETKKEEIKVAVEEKAKKDEENSKITQENVIEKVGENLRWFSSAYLGVIYGWPEIFEYKEVTGSVTIPGADPYAMVYELVGLESIDSLKKQTANYVSESTFSKFGSYEFVDELTEYNGKVYWCNLGVGDGPSIDYKKAKVLSSENGISKIQLDNINVLGDVLTETITVTVEYNKETSKYLITDWVVKQV